MTTNIAAMTDAELDELITAIQADRQRRADERAENRENLSASIRQSIAQLDALVGPDNPSQPAMTSLTEVRLYSRADMHANAGLGLELAFLALELLARTTRDIAAARG